MSECKTATETKPASDSRAGTDANVARQVTAALDAGDYARVRQLVEPLHAADIADLLEQALPGERRLFIEAVRGAFDPLILAELDEVVRDEVVDEFDSRELAAAVTELEIDDAVDVLEDLDSADQREVLQAVPAEDRAQIEEALGYPEDTAGRLMQRDLVAVPTFWTVGQTIDHLRESDDLPDEFFEIIVVDPAHHPVGTVPLNRAMCSKRSVVAADIMDLNPTLIPAAMDQEEIAYLFQQYNRPSAPVIDEQGRLVGVIMIDDIVDVIHEEHEEDLMRLGGVSAGDLYASAVATTRTRFTWLLVNLATAVVASLVIALFDAAIEKIVALAILMPIVASMGGNAGTQTLTVTVRAIATRELTGANALHLVNKEMLVGLLNGLLFAVLIGGVGLVWFGDLALGLVLAAAVVINMLVAGMAGILAPLGLERVGADPALASPVFLTTITDVVGFLSFLGLAAWLLV